MCFKHLDASNAGEVFLLASVLSLTLSILVVQRAFAYGQMQNGHIVSTDSKQEAVSREEEKL